MAYGLLNSGAPPQWSPGPGRLHYLADEYHFIDRKDVPLDSLVRHTARYLAALADRFEVYLVGQPSPRREGWISGDVLAREELIDDVLGWLRHQAVPLDRTALDMYAGDQPLWQQHDGIPGVLALTADQFDDLRTVWTHHGLPPDIYYPAAQQRLVVEPVELFGGVVLVTQRYSPLRWAHRDEEAVAALRLPSEQERATGYAEACQRFMQATMLRMVQLREPGQVPDKEQYERLAKLHLAVGDALRETVDSGQRDA